MRLAHNDRSNDDAIWFTALLTEHRAELQRYVRRRVGVDDVDDVVAEVLAAAWRHRVPRPSQARLWLFRAAHNELMHVYRSQGRRERLVSRLAAQPQQTVSEPNEDHDPMQAVRDCLAMLSIRDQELLRLTYWEGMNAQEVAYILGARAPAVRVRVHRARRRIEQLLPDRLRPTAITAGPNVDAEEGPGDSLNNIADIAAQHVSTMTGRKGNR